MITTSEWQGLIREERSEGQVYAPAKPAFPPSLAVKPDAKLRADEQEHHMRRSSRTPGIQQALSNAFLKSEELVSLRDGWIKLHYGK